MSRPTIAVDLDGVLAKYDPATFDPCHIGDPIPGALEFVRELQEFADIIVMTARIRGQDDEFDLMTALMVNEWLDRNGLKCGVWDRQGKPLAAAYVDDRGVRCDPQNNPGDFTLARYTCRCLCAKVSQAEAADHQNGVMP